MSRVREVELTDAFVELIRRAATDLPPDMEKALAKAKENEEPGSAAEGGTLVSTFEVETISGTNIHGIDVQSSGNQL